jgi:hypothetical protein
MHMLDRRVRAPLLATFLIGAASSISPPPARPADTDVADDATNSSAVGAFASKSEAEAFLLRMLPAATAANPKYRSPGSEVETRWLTEKISFKENENGVVIVSTSESVEDYRGDARSGLRTHTATFASDDVAISEETTDDLAENGEMARGVLFKCVGPPCIEAGSSGEISTSDSTDIYLQDDTQRRRILAAFQALQRKSASP